jgi:tRNA-guanine family transglycosylase
MKWPGSVLTDSGGYQIFSLPHSRSMTEAGAVFQSYVDGQRILLSPELSIQTQMAIGSDIMMVLDQCIPSTADEKAARAALQVTQRWAVRSLAAREDSPQSMFAIVQGALYPHLRKESAAGLVELILSVGLLSACGALSMSTPAGKPAATATVALATAIWLLMVAKSVPAILGLAGSATKTAAAALVNAVTPRLGDAPVGTAGTMAKRVSVAPKASRPNVFSL